MRGGDVQLDQLGYSAAQASGAACDEGRPSTSPVLWGAP